MRKICSHLKGRSVRNCQLLLMLLLLVAGLSWHVTTSHADDEPCGIWEHLGWTAGTVTWTADSNGNPQASISNATEHCGWSDPCEGTTQDNKTHPVPYTLISDEIVPDGNGYKRQYSWRADPVCENGTPTFAFASHPMPGDTLSISSDKAAICAGAISSPVHQTTITASFRKSNGEPLSGRTITFSVENSHSEYPASLSASTAVTNAQGNAVVTLTSSRKIGATAIVKATAGDAEAQTASISMDDAAEQWEIDPQELVADGESTANVRLTLSFNGEEVDGHQITWRINQIWDVDDNLIYKADPAFGSTTGYGSVSPTSTSTNNVGVVETTYTVGTEAGTIEFAALDYTVVANSPRVRTQIKDIEKDNVFYVYTYVHNGPSEASAGNPSGTRASMKFHVTLNALIKRAGTARPTLTTILFQPNRNDSPTQSAITGQLPSAPGGGIPAGNYTVWPYWSVDPGWDVTELRGKWNVSVKLPNNDIPPQQSTDFKIDKRDQIVQLANSWVGALAAQVAANSPSGTASCGAFTSMIYTHLGLGALESGVGPQLGQAQIHKTGKGVLLFYALPKPTGWDPAHVAIQDGTAYRININSNTGGPAVVTREGVLEGVINGPALPDVPTRYLEDIRHRSNIDLDAD